MDRFVARDWLAVNHSGDCRPGVQSDSIRASNEYGLEAAPARILKIEENIGTLLSEIQQGSGIADRVLVIFEKDQTIDIGAAAKNRPAIGVADEGDVGIGKAFAQKPQRRHADDTIA